MTGEEEIKVRAQAEAQALSLLLQFSVNQFVNAAGEAAVQKYRADTNRRVDESSPEK